MNVCFNTRIMAESSQAFIYSLCPAQLPRVRGLLSGSHATDTHLHKPLENQF